ncbi:MAG: FHA domain-containing protein [Candidatus Xenobia bacterium]
MRHGLLDTRYELIIIEGNDKGMHFPLNMQELHIGRRPSPGSQSVDWVYVNEPSVSRHHATLKWDAEKEKYTLHHVSKTNATLVNGRAVHQVDLNPNDLVRMGLLVFKVVRQMGRQTLQKKLKLSASDGRIQSPVTCRLLVLEGPDRGRLWVLDRKMTTIGRRGSRGDAVEGENIFLNDESIPFQQCVLVWDEKARSYGALQVETSPLPTVVYRSGSGGQQLMLDPKKPVSLAAEDLIMMGLTSLVYRVVPNAG